ncbi:MAG: DUF11 domain-containing protein [Candidatus Competibacteraceae bacterium]|nr:DUF11 domain-containing protein [Candidatus Competibacteraceae bacterium]
MAASAITFNDDLNATLAGLSAIGLPQNDVCGTGSQISGTTNLSLTGGNLSAGETCTFNVTLQTPPGVLPGNYPNTTSNVTATVSGETVTGDPAQNDLQIAGLSLTKSFTDDPVIPGGAVTLEFTLENASSLDATDIFFTDSLSSVLPGLVAVAPLPTNPCGAGSLIVGTSSLTFIGGSLTAGTSCSFSVTLQVPVGTASGSYSNSTSDLTATIGGSSVTLDPATDVLTVNANQLAFSKAFAGPVAASSTALLTFTIQNLNANPVSGIAFSDDLDAVIPGLVATGLPMNDVCGAGSVLSGTSLLTLTDGSLPASGSCSFPVTLQVPLTATTGTFLNTSSDLFSGDSLFTAGPAIADLVIEPPPTFAKGFGPDFIGVGQTSTLTFTIDNSASALAASSLNFTDNLPAGLVVATPPNSSTTCTGGTITAAAGSGTVSYSGGTVAAGASCTVQVDVTANATGTSINTSGDLTSSSGNSGTAADTLTANPQPGFSKAFAPNPTLIGGISTLTFAIDNTGSTVAATGLDFTDNLPTGMQIASPSNASTTCTGGTLTAVAGSGVVSYTGGTVGTAAICTVVVDVTVTTAGTPTNTSGDLTSSLGNSGTATDTLTVIPPPDFSKSFAPNQIIPGGVSTLTFTIDNTASTVAATGLDFTDNLPAGVMVATPPNASTTCLGGTITAAAGTSVINYTGGTAAAGASCMVQVDVIGSAAGTLVNTSDDLTSSSGNSGTATATLTVDTGTIGFRMNFAPGQILPGRVSTLTFTIDNTTGTVAASDLAFTENLPSGLVIADPANASAAVTSRASTTCSGGTLTAVVGTGVISFSGGTVNAGGVCAVQVEVTGNAVGQYTSVVDVLSSSVGEGGPASATLFIINPLPPIEPENIPDLEVWGLLLLIGLIGFILMRRTREIR